MYIIVKQKLQCFNMLWQAVQVEKFIFVVPETFIETVPWST